MKNGLRIIDSDGHAMEPIDLWERYIDEAFRPWAPRRWPGSGQWGRLEIEGEVVPKYDGPNPTEPGFIEYAREIVARRHGETARRGFDAESRLRDMDTEGVDIAFLYPTQGSNVVGRDYRNPQLATAAVAAYNTWHAEYCSIAPARLMPVGLIAPQEPAAMASEARRCVQELGMKGLVMRPNPVAGRNWHDPVYWPFYAAVEELGVPLAFHETAGGRLPSAGGDRFDNHLMSHAPQHPFEQMLAMESMILGGILERCPRLKVVFLESGCAWLTYWLWRLDEHIEYMGSLFAPQLTLTATEYFQRQCYISTEADEDTLKYVVDRVGDDRIVFATDYPHPDGKFPHAVEKFLETPGVSEETKRKILWDNSVSLYNLERVAVPV